MLTLNVIHNNKTEGISDLNPEIIIKKTDSRK